MSNAVGMAIAEEILKKKIGSSLINHKTYVIVSDGDLMEGISHEAMSLAGHLKLKNLVVFFDNNKISIDGSTKLAVSDNYKKRFESYGWSFQEVNGHNEKQISRTIKKTLKSKKPTLISCKTIIGYGSPNKSGKETSNGAARGNEEVEMVRKQLKWRYAPFEIPAAFFGAAAFPTVVFAARTTFIAFEYIRKFAAVKKSMKLSSSGF